MQRYASQYLQQWLQNSARKPMIMRGARQVGKTWLVRHLVESSGKQLVELNFEKFPAHKQFFHTNDVQVILRDIGLAQQQTLQPEQTLLFLDEAQAFPDVLAKLRWFYEDMPELAVVAAGSLLDFTLGDHQFSMPVGRVSFCYIEPLSFEEFLLAKNETVLLAFIQQMDFTTPVALPVHHKLLDLFREYLIVGGMPEAVATWVNTDALAEVARIQSDLRMAYRDDFVKYTPRIDTQYLDAVWQAVPRLLGGKFVYSQVARDLQSTKLKAALGLLCQARVCYKAVATAANGVPLMAEANAKRFKVGLLDVGMTSALLGLQLHEVNQIGDINLINQGAISEQIVGQLLRASQPLYQAPQTYYWARENKSANAELDYVWASGGQIVPIEVKSGATGSLKSLHLFMHLKQLPHAVRVNADLPSQVPVAVKLHDGQVAKYQLSSIPFYLIEQLQRLLQISD